MEEVRVHSTPVPTRDSDKTDNETINLFRETMGEIKQMFNALNNRLDNNEKKFETKFDVMSSDINSRFDMSDTKFNEQNKKLDALNKRFDTNYVKFEQYKEQNMRFENSINVKLDYRFLVEILCVPKMV